MVDKPKFVQGLWVTVTSELAPCGYPNKYHKLNHLKLQKIFLSHFLKARSLKSFLLSQNQGVDRTVLFLMVYREICSLPLPDSDGCQLCLTCGHTKPISASLVMLSLPLLCVSNLSLLNFVRNAKLDLELTGIIQDNLSMSISLT